MVIYIEKVKEIFTGSFAKFLKRENSVLQSGNKRGLLKREIEESAESGIILFLVI